MSVEGDPTIPFTLSGIHSHNYTKHKDEVNCISFSMDMEVLVTGSDDGRTRLFDNVKHIMVYKFPRREAAICCVQVSNDSRYIASGGHDKLIKVYSLRDVKDLFSLAGHEKSVESLAFTKACDRLCSGSWDRTIIIWELQTGLMVHRYYFHDSLVQCLAVAPDDNLLACGSYDRSISLWPLNEESGFYQMAENLERKYKSKAVFKCNRSNRCVALLGHKSNVHTIVFSHSGKYLASGGWDTHINVWDVTELRLLHQLRVTQGGWIQAVGWSPDDSCIVASSDQDCVRVWTMDSGNCIGTYEIENQQTTMFVRMKDDGNIILAGGDFVTDVPTLPTEEEENDQKDGMDETMNDFEI